MNFDPANINRFSCLSSAEWYGTVLKSVLFKRSPDQIMLMKNKNIAQAFPLPMATEGEMVKIVAVAGGKRLIKRLIAMGLIEETVVTSVTAAKGKWFGCGLWRNTVGFGFWRSQSNSGCPRA